MESLTEIMLFKTLKSDSVRKENFFSVSFRTEFNLYVCKICISPVSSHLLYICYNDINNSKSGISFINILFMCSFTQRLKWNRFLRLYKCFLLSKKGYLLKWLHNLNQNNFFFFFGLFSEIVWRGKNVAVCLH